MNRNAKAFVTAATEIFGANAILSRDQIQHVVDERSVPYPFWFVTRQEFRSGRGQYQLPTLPGGVPVSAGPCQVCGRCFCVGPALCPSPGWCRMGWLCPGHYPAPLTGATWTGLQHVGADWTRPHPGRTSQPSTPQPTAQT